MLRRAPSSVKLLSVVPERVRRKTLGVHAHHAPHVRKYNLHPHAYHESHGAHHAPTHAREVARRGSYIEVHPEEEASVAAEGRKRVYTVSVFGHGIA